MRAFLCIFLFYTSLLLAGEEPKSALRFGLQINYQPFHISNPREGYPGIDVEIARLLANFLEKEAQFKFFSVKELLTAVQSQKIDIALGGISSNLERGRRVLFSDPYLIDSHAALLNRRRLPPEPDNNTFPGREFSRLEDLQHFSGLSIGVMKDSTNHLALRNGSEYQSHTIRPYSHRPTMIEDLKAQRIAILAGDNTFIRTLLLRDKELLSSFVYLRSRKNEEHLSMAVHLDQLELLIRINFFLKELRRTGRLEEIRRRYQEDGSWIP